MPIKSFILASSSPHRLELLSQIGFEPEAVVSPDIDESEHKHETPSAYVKRIATEKALAVAKMHPEKVILAADVIIVVGTKLIHKAKDEAEQKKIMQRLSGKAHRVLSAVCVVNAGGKPSLRLVSTKVQMKKLSPEEINDYVACREWVGCCGFKIEGCFAAYVKKIIGSYSGVVGLPLYETKNLLNGAGIK